LDRPKADSFELFLPDAEIKSASSLQRRRKTMKRENTDKNLVSYTFDELESLKDDTDWERVDSMMDEDISAVSDADDPPLTETELDQFKRAIYVRGQLIWEESNEDALEIPLPIDKEILEWFIKQGGDCVSQINTVLRMHIESQKAVA